MSLINVSNLTFAYDGSYDNIFENVSFQIDTDWKLGFTGRNGRGKTTFLNLLMGKYEYGGSITAQTSFEYFPFEVPGSGMSGAQVIEAVCPDCVQWELERELSLLEVEPDTLNRQFHELSNGERTKLMLAALFLKQNSFPQQNKVLLIDEPTNHLDMRGREIVSRYLNGKKGFILVSHDRAFLDRCVDHILSINRAGIEVRRGSFSAWLADKERRDNLELEENRRLKKDIKRLTDSARRASSWSEKAEKAKIGSSNSGVSTDRGYVGHKAAKMMKRSKSIEARREAAAKEKSGLLKNIESSGSLKIVQTPYHAERLALLDGVSIFYDGKAACRDVGFSIERGDRIALCGANGSGKSSLAKLICGSPLEYTGSLQIGSRLRISYVSQDTSFLSGSLSDYAAKNGIDQSLFMAILRKLDLSRTQLEKDMSSFSGGQKKKVLIAGSLCQSAHLLVWDEPLNYIDVISRIQIEEMLLEYRPTILFIEHDGVFCDKIATKTVNLTYCSAE